MRILGKKHLIRKFGSPDGEPFLLPWAADPPHYEILRRARLYLLVDPDPFAEDQADADGSRRRFAQCFRGTWLSIPPDYRKTMLDFWRPGAFGMLWIPMISLENDAPKVGAYQRMGRTFTFNSGAAELQSANDLLRDLIGHEIAHAWHDTQPGSFIASATATNDEVECEADDLAEQWGFDMKSLRAFCNGHVQQLTACDIHINPGEMF